MRKLTTLIILVAALFWTGYMQDQARPDWKKISPFTAVSFEDGSILTEFEGTVYELVSIEGIESDFLIKAAKSRFGRQWQKRIREDIAEVLEAAGAPEGNFVDLELKDLQTERVRKVSDVEMTEEKRKQIKKSS